MASQHRSEHRRPRWSSARRTVSVVAVALLMIALPTETLAASPIAVDDPGTGCGNTAYWGGAFPIPEDYSAGSPAGYERWFLLIPPCDLLSNDSDADGDTLSYVIETGPTHGDIVEVSPQWYAYRPDHDYSTLPGDVAGGTWTSDSFTYRAFDGTSYSNTASMRFWIAPVNDPPSFTAGPTVTVNEDSGAYSAPWATDVLAGPANEADQTVSFEITGIQSAGHGSHLFAAGPAIDSSGNLTFTPAPDAYGSALVTIRAKDDGGLDWYGLAGGTMDPPDDTSDPTTFQITVQPVDDAVAIDDDALVVEDDYRVIDVLANDTDLDQVVVTGVSQPTHGSATIGPGVGSVTYVPDPGFSGSDLFTYTITGGATATVHMTVTPILDVIPPVITTTSETLPAQTVGSTTVNVRLAWVAVDPASGIAHQQLQMSVDGGSYANLGPTIGSARSDVRTLTIGHAYRFRVRATDGAGNTSAYVDWPSLTPVRYQETSAPVTYTGTWARSVNASMSGGGSRHASTAGRRVTFAFIGRDVAWMATRTPSGGRASVSIDGVAMGTVDLGAAANQFRRLVFQRHLAVSGPHTMIITAIGDGRVDVDGFIVLR